MVRCSESSLLGNSKKTFTWFWCFNTLLSGHPPDKQKARVSQSGAIRPALVFKRVE